MTNQIVFDDGAAYERYMCPVPYVASVRTGYKEGGCRATGKL